MKTWLGGPPLHMIYTFEEQETMKLTVEMPWGKNLSVNHMRFGKGGGYRRKPEVQAWMHNLQWQVYSCATQYEALIDDEDNIEEYLIEPEPPFVIVVDFRFPDKRKRDTHNFFKVICDAVAAGLGIDDQHIRISTGEVEIDRENPGFTITVSDDG